MAHPRNNRRRLPRRAIVADPAQAVRVTSCRVGWVALVDVLIDPCE